MSPETRDIRESFAHLKAWVEHWIEDAKCGLAPTSNSLTIAYGITSKALARIDAERTLSDCTPFRTLVLDEAGRDVLVSQAEE